MSGRAAAIARTRRGIASFLRRPAVIVGEVAALAIGATLAATLPQEPATDEIGRFASDAPALAAVTGALGLHRIVTSAWFLAIVALCLASLVAVQAAQWRRVRRLWGGAVDPAAFRRAPFRREIPLEAARRAPEAPRVVTSGRIAILGSPVFHLGLLLVVTAGLVRLLAHREAVGRFLEGETIPAAPSAFEAEGGGWLSAPLALPRPVRLVAVEPRRYPSGALEQLGARVVVGEAEAALAINAPLDVDGIRVSLDGAYGVAAVLERARTGRVDPLVAWLEPRGEELRGGVRTEDGIELRVRAGASPRPERVEARVLRDGVLLRVVEIGPRTAVPLGLDDELRLVALPGWARLRASRDASRPLFFAGIATAIAGVALMFGVTRVDSAVFVDGEKLVVALRPERFAALYAERFERLCKEWET